MNKNKLFFLFFLLIFSFRCYSQKIDNVDFSVINNTITVNYDLINCPKKHVYDIKLKVISNTNTFEPKSVSGDLIKVSPGKFKKIELDVLRDKTEFTGKIQTIVEISNSYSTKVSGGHSYPSFSVSNSTPNGKIWILGISGN